MSCVQYVNLCLLATKSSELLFPNFVYRIAFSWLDSFRKRHTVHSMFGLNDLIKTVEVTVQDSQSGKSFSSILNLAKNVLKSPINC